MEQECWNCGIEIIPNDDGECPKCYCVINESDDASKEGSTQDHTM